MIKVNVNLHNRRPGSIVKVGDKDFKTFKAYAEKGSRRNGMVICEMQDTGKFDRPAAVARLEELGIEFKGNMSNDNMTQLLIDSEAAALDKGDIRLSRDFVVNKLNELEVDFDEGMSDEGLEQLLKDTEEQLAEAAAGAGDQDGPDGSDLVVTAERLKELGVEFEDGLDADEMKKLLEEAEALVAGSSDGADKKKEPVEFNRADAMTRLKELKVEFAGNISNANLEKLLKDTEEGLLAVAEKDQGKEEKEDK